jgi:metal-responsive CopG/Arc/MetJ family transcriptional regulator
MPSAVDTVPAVERIMLSLPKDLLEKLTALAKRKGLSRASFIRMVLTEHVNEEERESSN